MNNVHTVSAQSFLATLGEQPLRSPFSETVDMSIPTSPRRAARPATRFAIVLGAALFASVAHAQIGTCTAGNTCSIETRLPGVNGNLCTDGVDNDGNGSCDTGLCAGSLPADPHCNAEALCQDGFDNDNDGLIDEAFQLNAAGTNAGATDCACVRLAARLPGGNACTAEDMTVSYSAKPIVSDGCINSNDTVSAQLFANITVKPERYDLAMWLSLTSSDGLDGTLCTRQVLQPVSTTAPDPLDPAGNGPFNTIDGDTCGDLAANLSAIYAFPYEVTAPCTDLILSSSGQGGWVDLGQCGSWQQPGSNPTCNNISGAVPGTSSKCNCARGDTGVPGPNLRMACSQFAAGGVGLTLDPGETASYTLSYTNTVASCTPETPLVTDPFGRERCGTASFIRIVVEYGTADDRGDFYYDNGSGNVAVPACSAPAVVSTNDGVLCNDTALDRLIWAPRDTNLNNAYGVISAFSGTQSLPFRYTLTDTSSTTGITLTSRIYWDNSIDGGDGVISTTDAVDLTGALLQGPFADHSCNTTSQATPVTLGSFRATPSGRGVRFDWTTETEVGNVGFDLYARVGDERVKLNGEPIPTRSTDSLETQRYSLELDVPADATAFEIEDLDLRGQARRHGPFEAEKQYGAAVDAEPVAWAEVRREHGLGRRGDARGLGRKSTRLAAGATVAPSGPIELHVDRDGLYRVTYEALLAAGFDLARESSAQLGLTVSGAAVPIHVQAGTRFGPGSWLEFWGEAIDTLYSKTNVYRLASGVKRPARAAVSTAAPSGTAAATYPETRSFGRNRGYAFWSPGDDPFFDTEMLVFSSPGQWQFPFAIDGYVPAGGAAELRAEVFGGTTIAAVDPDHHVQFLVNGAYVGEATFDGTTGTVFRAAIPAGALVEGANTLTIVLPGVPGAPYDMISLDDFAVTYPRAFAAESGALDFTGSSGRYDVSGLPGAAVVAYRKSGTALTRLTGTTVVPEGGSFRASVAGLASAASYRVASENALLAPKTIQAARAPVDIRTGPASYLVISHAAFLPGLAPLVAARSAEGHTVKVVDVEDVYAQFRGGVFDAHAIRDYVAHAHSAMGTRFVLLVGGDTYDYHDYLGLAPVSFLPSLFRDAGPIVHHAPSDPSYADVDRDGLQDLAIGRLPVRTPAELDAVVAKILEYGQRTYVGAGLFAADYADAGANESFAAATDRLVGNLPPDWTVNRVYLDQTPLATARAELFAGIDAGATLTHYTGHSGLTSWGSSMRPASQHLFTIWDVASLTNAGRPTVVSQLGCWNTYYASPRTESVGSRLLLAENRGAAAVLGSTTLTDDANSNRFGALLATLLATPGRTLGEAVVEAKRAFVAGSLPDRDVRDVLLAWTILGDPALVVTP